MIPDGFGDPIPGFENAYRQSRPDTPYLTTPWSFGGGATSGRGAFAFTFGSHDESVLTAEHREPLFYTFTSRCRLFLDTPRLAHPRMERVLGATRTMQAFITFPRSFVGFGRKPPHVLVGQQLKAFFEIHDERCRPTLHLTSTSLAFTFAFRSHRAFTSATHGTGTMGGRPLFLYLFFLFTGVGHGLGHGHGHGHGLGVVVVDLGWTFGWRCGAPRDDLPLHRRW